MSAPETVFPSEAVATDITGETDLVGNGEFLLAVFGELVDARPVVVSFEGNPASVPPKVWFGRPWQGTPDLAISLPASANNYFSLAVFRPDEAGHFRRQKPRFQALYAVMLDDIGTKVALERLTLPPTWLLETSPGNHQAGYAVVTELASMQSRASSIDVIEAEAPARPECPHCASSHTIKHGRYGDLQRFRCRHCNRSSFVRLIYHPLWGNMTTGQVSCYRTGQFMNSQQTGSPPLPDRQ